MSSLKNLAAGIVDYAGLFPPAGLEMEAVVHNYNEYLSSSDHWMLGRLIVPAGRLTEFEELAKGLLPTTSDSEPWRISALVPGVDSSGQDFQVAISAIKQFNSRHAVPENGLAIADVIETRATTAEQVVEISELLPLDLSAFLEIPCDHPPNELVEEIAGLGDDFGRTRFFAKIRTGGVKPEMIPPVADVARFISVCGEHLLPFKATAGLHHPVRGEFQLTYEPDSPRGTMHGFLNVFVAACFAFGGQNEQSLIEDVLKTESRDEFKFDQKGLEWRGNHVSNTRLTRIRKRFAFSFGSCSFVEPVEELRPVE